MRVPQPGERALPIIAEIPAFRSLKIRATVRRTDIVTRYDAQTFALILPHTGANVTAVCDRLMGSLMDWLQARDWHTGRAPLHIGMGLACYPEEAMQAGPLTSLAESRIVPPQALPMAA